MTLQVATSITLKQILALQETNLHVLLLQFQIKIPIIKNKD